MAHYDEFSKRETSDASKRASRYINKRVLVNFLKIAGKTPSQIDVLEVGSGKGYLGEASIAMGFRSYTGVEPNQLLARESRELLKCTIIEDSLPNLASIPTNSYDVVVTYHVLEHATTPFEARAWCEEMLRVARSGGYVLVVSPDIVDYKGWFWDVDWTHGYPTTPFRISRIFTDLGTEVPFRGKLHFGHTGPVASFLAHGILALLPIRLGNRITEKLVGRPMFTALGFLLFGMSFVIAQKA